MQGLNTDFYNKVIPGLLIKISNPRTFLFAQKRSNHVLAVLMAASFYLQLVLGCLVFTIGPFDWGLRYWIGTAHPIFRVPVFFMGVCAGVLCVRIQQGDINAFHSM